MSRNRAPDRGVGARTIREGCGENLPAFPAAHSEELPNLRMIRARVRVGVIARGNSFERSRRVRASRWLQVPGRVGRGTGNA